VWAIRRCFLEIPFSVAGKLSLANRVTSSDELYRIYGLTPQEGPIEMAMVREMTHLPNNRRKSFALGSCSCTVIAAKHQAVVTKNANARLSQWTRT
jgi:hypothetical protein